MIPLSVVSQGFGNETITLSATNYGYRLDEEYKKAKGKYPSRPIKYTFIVPFGVNVISASVTNGAIVDGLNWPEGASIEVINYGSILGRGGKGGRGAEWISKIAGFYLHEANPANDVYMRPSQEGQQGGPALTGVRKTPMVVSNYGVISGGGGGGGGGGCSVFIRKQKIASSYIYIDRTLGGAGSGGGAPYGERAANANTIESYFDNPEFYPHYKGELNNDVQSISNIRAGVNSKDPYWVIKYYIIGLGITQYKPAGYDSTKDVIHIHAWIPHYLSDGVRYQLAWYTTNINEAFTPKVIYTHNNPERTKYYEYRSPHILRQSEKGALAKGGAPGYGGAGLSGTGASRAEVLMPDVFDIPVNGMRGGKGGDVGQPGDIGVRNMATRLYQKAGTWPGYFELKGGYEPSRGGGAGYIKNGLVNVTNKSGGTTKGVNEPSSSVNFVIFWTSDSSGKDIVNDISKPGTYYCWVYGSGQYAAFWIRTDVPVAMDMGISSFIQTTNVPRRLGTITVRPDHAGVTVSADLTIHASNSTSSAVVGSRRSDILVSREIK